MTKLFLDLETFSEIPIQNGSYKYSEKAEILLFAYALDDSDVKVWDLTATKTMPAELKAALDDPEVTIYGHNIGGFDRIMIERVLGIKLPIERIHDTMARAYSHGMPGGLDLLCDIMNVPVTKAKDKEGKKLIQLFCVPKKDKPRATRQSHPLEWDRFISYAKLDIESIRYIDKIMPLWNYTGDEHKLWQLDQRINERGVQVDIELAKAAIRAVNRAQEKLAARTDDLTLGDVASTTQRDELLRHVLEAYGVELPDLQASTLEHRIEDPNLPLEVKELLQIRLQASITSTAKYGKLLRNVSSDGRMRGNLQFSGAARTKRYAARQMQLQNLPRPTLSGEKIDFGIECLKADCEDLFFENVMELASNCIRGCLMAPHGKKLVVSDLSNIEGRVVAWLAGEESKLEAFRAFDKGLGPDIYIRAFARAFRISFKDVTKYQRQIGKVMELMLGFQSGVNGFVTGAMNYKIDLVEMTTKVLPELPQDVLEKAEWWWSKSLEDNRTYGLEKDVFMACDGLKQLWRREHPNIESLWSDMENAARNAIESKDTVFKCRRVSFARLGNWLRMTLPSGYYLCYPGPRVDDKGKISFMGIDQYSRKWSRINTYAGKLTENATQATARDIMMGAFHSIEKAGYEIVLSVHDEILTETPDTDEFTPEGLSGILATQPPWAQDLPLAAGGFSGYRYRKQD